MPLHAIAIADTPEKVVDIEAKIEAAESYRNLVNSSPKPNVAMVRGAKKRMALRAILFFVSGQDRLDLDYGYGGSAYWYALSRQARHT